MAATQSDTLRIFTALRLVRRTWAGSLLVGVGLDDAGRALALASLAAGAASIFLEEDAAQLRAAQREGCCTFTVTSLDEALRVVKNEVRQKHAIAVGLRGKPAAWLHDMVERGVQPQAFATSRDLAQDEADAVAELSSRGMVTLSGFSLSNAHSDSIDLEDVLARATSNRWSLHEQGAVSFTERREKDAHLQQAMRGEDAMGGIAKQWLGAAPALFPRALNRCHWTKA